MRTLYHQQLNSLWRYRYTENKCIEYVAANREVSTKGTQKHNKKRNENLIEGKIIYDVAKSFQIDYVSLKVHIKFLKFCKQHLLRNHTFSVL